METRFTVLRAEPELNTKGVPTAAHSAIMSSAYHVPTYTCSRHGERHTAPPIAADGADCIVLPGDRYLVCKYLTESTLHCPL